MINVLQRLLKYKNIALVAMFSALVFIFTVFMYEQTTTITSENPLLDSADYSSTAFLVPLFAAPIFFIIGKAAKRYEVRGWRTVRIGAFLIALSQLVTAFLIWKTGAMFGSDTGELTHVGYGGLSISFSDGLTIEMMGLTLFTVIAVFAGSVVSSVGWAKVANMKTDYLDIPIVVAAFFGAFNPTVLIFFVFLWTVYELRFMERASITRAAEQSSQPLTI